jgi:hypothetical protein
MRDLVNELFQEITEVIDALPVRVLAGQADQLGRLRPLRRQRLRSVVK